MTGVELYRFFGALVLLGVGWNFGFIGATALLAEGHSVEERGRVQGMNDHLDRLARGYSVQVAVDLESEEMLWQTPPILRAKLAPYLR